MTTTGPFFLFELPPPPPPRPNAPAFDDDDDDDADRCGRRRSAARPANRAAPSVGRENTVTDALIEAARQVEEERALEARLDDRREAVVGNVVGGSVVAAEARAAEAAVDPHAGAEVEAQQLPARLEAIEDADMEGSGDGQGSSERASERAKRKQSLFREVEK